jgi:protein required for attachment to host cells
VIRPVYSSALRHAIVREVAKDLVKRPVHEIERFMLRAVGMTAFNIATSFAELA